MTDKKRPKTEFVPLPVSTTEAPVAAPRPASSLAPQPAPLTPQPAAPTPPPDKPFSGRGSSQQTARLRVEQTKHTGMMLALVALFVVLLVVGGAYLVWAGIS